MADFLSGLFGGADNLEKKVDRLIQAVQADNIPQHDVFRMLLEKTAEHQQEAETLRKEMETLRQEAARLTAIVESFPHRVVVFLEFLPAEDGARRALVATGRTAFSVHVGNRVDPAVLERGDEVVMAPEERSVLGKLCRTEPRGGETAVFDRRLPGSERLVLKSRDEEVVVQPAGSLNTENLVAGDLIRWDRSAAIAYEKIERSQSDDLFLERTPSEEFDHIGGLGSQIQQVRDMIDLHVRHRNTAAKYKVKRPRGILLTGPPGTGKTMMARALANYMASLSNGKSLFMSVKPGQFNSMWFGQTEANYRQAFHIARKAGAAHPDVPIVMFFDEIDAVGSVRGRSLNHVDDRVMQAFMAELDGLEDRGNVLVVAATNRQNVLDPAIVRPGRLGDLCIDIPRPDKAAAEQILSKHLPSDIPYADGHATEANNDPRDVIIKSASERIFSQEESTTVAVLEYRSGNKRFVYYSNLVNGAVLANICRRAIYRACLRDANGRERGMQVEDVLDVIPEEFRAVAGRLTGQNILDYLPDFPIEDAVAGVGLIPRHMVPGSHSK